jgi:hypothetical protein
LPAPCFGVTGLLGTSCAGDDTSGFVCTTLLAELAVGLIILARNPSSGALLEGFDVDTNGIALDGALLLGGSPIADVFLDPGGCPNAGLDMVFIMDGRLLGGWENGMRRLDRGDASVAPCLAAEEAVGAMR